jgi:hypothetical protein
MSAVKRLLVAGAAAVTLMTLGSSAFADGRNWNDGPVINVAAIRTLDGHFDDYMQWLATVWKKQQEAAKKAGLIISYDVLVVEAHSPNDPDIYLVTRFKNWAALDGLGGKFDKVSSEVEGSVEKANQNSSARGKLRTVLGSQTMMVAELK